MPLLAVAGGLAFARGAVADPCPFPNTINICGHSTSYSAPARGDSLAHCVIFDDYLGNKEAAGYDIPAGRVWADEALYSGLGTNIGASSHDVYWIVGPPSADPISGTAVLDMNGWGGCRSFGTAAFTVQGQSASGSFHNDPTAAGPCNTLPPLGGAVTLPVSATVGAPFEIVESVTLNGGFSGSAYVSARLSFTNLPAGYTVTSCNGFGGGGATPSFPTSWGRMKAVYR